MVATGYFCFYVSIDMNLQAYVAPTKAARAFREGGVSKSSLTIYKTVAIVSFAIMLASLFLLPASSSAFQPFLDIFFIVIYLGVPVYFYKKKKIQSELLVDLFFVLNIVSTIRMVLASLVFLLIGSLLLTSSEYNNFIILQIGEGLVWGGLAYIPCLSA